MTCILVAHLGGEVIIAADKRVTHITQDGVKTPAGDNEEKIVRTKVGVITGAGSVEMLDHVKTVVGGYGFDSPDEVLNLILDTRNSFSERYADSQRLQIDLAETSWMFTYPTTVNDQPVTRFVYYHQPHGAESLRRLDVGKVICFPGGFSLEQAQEVQAKLQGVVTASLDSVPSDKARQLVISYMLNLMSEISESSNTVSSNCDVAWIDDRHVRIAIGVSKDDAPKFIRMEHNARS